MEAAAPGLKQTLLGLGSGRILPNPNFKRLLTLRLQALLPSMFQARGLLRISGVSFLSFMHGWFWLSPVLSPLELGSWLIP